jgi:tryptophanase
MALPFEPYKTKSVESIPVTTREYRATKLAQADYNPFALDACDVTIDLLTDSGTSAMSDVQWGALMRGDESYAGSASFIHFKEAVQRVTGYEFVLPTHQGRSAENIFFSAKVKPGDIIPNNTHFDTTEANVCHKGGTALNLPVAVSRDLNSLDPFKGNMDLDRLDEALKKHGKKIPLVMITVTNNSAGGQPVSMENIRRTRQICDQYSVPLYFDCARYAENCYFIKQREAGFEDKSVEEIAQEMFSYGHGALMSAKKDALVNIGGFLATSEEDLHTRASEIMVVIEGFVTYGGLAGRDMEVLATGLIEGLDERYLESRIGQVAFLAEKLQENGVPVLQPPGGHAVYIDAKAFLPDLPQSVFPAWALSCEGYLEGGVRTVEIGSVMFAHLDPDTGKMVYPDLELVRLAIPRRVYSSRHMEYVAETFGKLVANRERIKGVRYTYQPERLRHFLSKFEPIG